MKSMQPQRPRSQAVRRASSNRLAAPARSRQFAWKAAVVGGLAIIVLAGWFGPGLMRHSDSEPAASVVAPKGARADLSAQAPGIQRGLDAARKKQALIEQVNHGNELLTEGKVDEAVEVLTQAARLSPESDDVHYNLGLALTRQGKLEEAIKQYEEALRIFPDYVEAHNNLGNLLMRAGSVDAAIAHFERAVKVMPDYAAAHNNLGTALQKAGRADEALVQFQQAVKCNPDYWEAHFNVGAGCLQQGRLEEARTELETVLRLHPDFPPALSLLARIQNRQSGDGPAGP